MSTQVSISSPTADLPPSRPLGNARMDEDHGRLEGMLALAIRVPDAELPAYAADVAAELAAHFAREEAMMERGGFPALHCHKEFHAELLEAVNGIAASAAEMEPAALRRVLAFRVAALVDNHVDSVDRMTAGYLASVGIFGDDPTDD